MTKDSAPAMGMSTCPGCGLTARGSGGTAPEEHRASPACWAMYGQLLSRSYTDPDYRAMHQMLVNAYTAQHAGGTSRRQTVTLCLMTLCLFAEDSVDPATGPALHKRMVTRRPACTWLAPPPQPGLLTVADVLTAQDADEHCRLVREWGQQVWRT